MNMSYCMFENTVQDLFQVLNRVREVGSWEELTEDSSEYEIQAMKDLPRLCERILEHYKDIQIED